MNRIKIFNSFLLCVSLFIITSYGQINSPPPPPKPVVKTLKHSRLLAKNLESLPPNYKTSRENREKSYAKLLEGQRYIWKIRRSERRLIVQSGARLAKKALLEAIKLDPKLAEAYTALAEIAISTSPQDINEAIKLSEIATKLDINNYGGFRLIGRLYTIKSNLGRGRINKTDSDKAIAAWKQITRMDSRNAEAWAFLSEFYREKPQVNKRIDALKNWLSSATPLDVGFYNRVIQNGKLTMQNASILLGEALILNNQNDEALSVLTRAVADSPNNLEAIGLLSQALDKTTGKSLLPAIEALRQAVFANPNNVSLNLLLAQTIAKTGNIDDAISFLESAVKKYSSKDKINAANFQMALGDIYSEAGKTNDAIINYKAALKLRGINKKTMRVNDKDFAFLVINKIINSYKNVERYEDAELTINTYRPLFGKKDISLDKEYINILRDSGKNIDALKSVRLARTIVPNDYSLIRSEANILTDLNRVDEGTALIQELIDKKPENVSRSIMFDNYVNYLFISSLYLQANRHEDAIDNANKAFDAADGKERKQIARLTLASATQAAGNFNVAEDILNSILKETPDNPIALNNLGYLFLERGKNIEMALILINRAVKIDPKNPSYLDSLGWAYYKLGKFIEAEKYLVKALKYDKSSPTILEHLGDVYIKKGDTDRAIDAWKKAVKLTSNSTDKKRIESKINK